VFRCGAQLPAATVAATAVLVLRLLACCWCSAAASLQLCTHSCCSPCYVKCWTWCVSCIGVCAYRICCPWVYCCSSPAATSKRNWHIVLTAAAVVQQQLLQLYLSLCGFFLTILFDRCCRQGWENFISRLRRFC
jgi:hypothetical protein